MSHQTSDHPSDPVIVIEPSKGWVPVRLRDLWEYRDLLYFLVWRDVKVRYKQTVLGAAWAILQPLMTMVVFTVFFGGLARCPPMGCPTRSFPSRRCCRGPFSLKALEPVVEQPCRHAQPDHQGLLPAAGDPACRRALGPGGLRHLAFVVLLGHDGLLRDLRPAGACSGCPLSAGPCVATALGVGLWLSALNVRVPGRALRCAVPGPVLDVCHTGGLPASSLIPERLAAGCTASTRWRAWWRASAGRCWGRIARPGRWTARLAVSAAIALVVSGQRAVLLPAHGADASRTWCKRMI